MLNSRKILPKAATAHLFKNYRFSKTCIFRTHGIKKKP